uniref:Uncharacterized protein n=1 Tax=Meloidogyne enterolobii TaxID=390850 RepID=A0A6V7VYS2_MELEN|nr:unnamed protein product [Meloidogyne enterolobii]
MFFGISSFLFVCLLEILLTSIIEINIIIKNWINEQMIPENRSFNSKLYGKL